MDKKKLILITYDKLNSDHYKEELTNFFGRRNNHRNTKYT